MPRCAQAAAVHDAQGRLPLQLAAHVGAADEVKQVLFEAHRDAAPDKGLCDVLLWGEGAVRSVLVAQPEVSTDRAICCGGVGW